MTVRFARVGAVWGLALCLLPAPWAAGAESTNAVRVGLVSSASKVLIGPGQVRLPDGKRITLADKTPVTAQASGVRVGTRNFSGRFILAPGDPDAGVPVNGRLYRGQVEFVKSGAGVTVVNVLPVDDYVRGILLHEVSPEWPAESLKAQAVISRTYALANKGRHGKQGFDLCVLPHCQVYGGKSSERETTNAAVRDTHGQALTYRDKLISAVFHSTCGGQTENAAGVWAGGGNEILKSVRCQWCSASPKYEWKATFELDDVERKLKKGGLKVGKPRRLQILNKTRTGRVTSVRVVGSEGSADVQANRFRLMMDPRALRSTWWTGLSIGGGSWRFTGRGWGHGVGLCQWGAKAMSDDEYDHEQILRYYYRGAEITQLKK